MKYKYKKGNKNVKWKFKEIIKLNKVPRCGNRSLTQDETRARCVRFLNSRFGFYFMSLYRALNTFLIEMHSTTKNLNRKKWKLFVLLAKLWSTFTAYWSKDRTLKSACFSGIKLKKIQFFLYWNLSCFDAKSNGYRL